MDPWWKTLPMGREHHHPPITCVSREWVEMLEDVGFTFQEMSGGDLPVGGVYEGSYRDFHASGTVFRVIAPAV